MQARTATGALLVLITACAAGPPTSTTGTEATSTTDAAPLTAAEGQELSPEAMPPLPAEGVAVGMGTTVVLVDLDGTVLGHLDGFVVDPTSEAPGPIVLTDGEGAAWLLDGTGLTRTEPGRHPLAFGADLLVPAPPEHVRIVRDGEVLYDGDSAEVTPNWERRLVTLTEWRQAGSTFEPVTSTILDLSSGERFDSPPGCNAVERLAQGFVVTCRGGAAATLETVVDGARTVLAPAPDADWEIPSGHWRLLIPSPDGRAYLGQWSGECEVPTAIWMEDGASVPIVGLPLAEAPDSHALGWTAIGEAVVLLAGVAPCGQGAPEPGLYLAADPATLTLLYPIGHEDATVHMWRPLPRS